MEINKKISKNCCFHGRQSECNFCANKKKSLSVIFSIAPENLSFFFSFIQADKRVQASKISCVHNIKIDFENPIYDLL